MEFRDYKDFTEDFVKLGRDFVKAKRHYINIDNIGNAKSQFFKQRDLVDFAVIWLGKNRKKIIESNFLFDDFFHNYRIL